MPGALIVRKDPPCVSKILKFSFCMGGVNVRFPYIILLGLGSYSVSQYSIVKVYYFSMYNTNIVPGFDVVSIWL